MLCVRAIELLGTLFDFLKRKHFLILADMKSILLFFAALMILTGMDAKAGEEWSLARDKEGIKVYTRKYAEYNYKEYKGITVMSGSVDDLIGVLKNVDDYHLWSYNCVPNSTSILKSTESNGEYYIYMEIRAPLVANRDVVSVYKFHTPEADGSVLVEFWGDSDFIPKKKGLVRVPELIGYWKAIPIEGGKIKVVHQAFSHPGGNPPAGLVNSSNVNAPFSMLSKIREIIEK